MALLARGVHASEGRVTLPERAARDAAKRLRRLPPAQADPGWLTLARGISENTYAMAPQDSRKAYQEALQHLSLRSLVVLAAFGPNPELSEAYVRARLARGEVAEAGAEARDAIARYGVGDTPRLIELARKCSVTAPTAGGVGNSICRIAVLCAGGPGESGESECRAVVDGVSSELGQETEHARVDFSAIELGPDGQVDPVLAARTVRRALERGAGVVILIRADAALLAAALAETRRVGVPLLESGSRIVEAGFLSRQPADGGIGPVRYSLGPNANLRAKAILEAAQAAGVRRVAVAIPKSAETPALAMAVLEEARQRGMDPMRLDYDSGRRNYKPEADRFAASGADAIFLAGPGEESGDWARALAGLRRKPQLLGDAELDPAGFHDLTRAALEGAIFVSDYWQPADSTAAYRDDERSENGASMIELEIAGRAIGRAIVAGAASPGDLFRQLEDCGGWTCSVKPTPGAVVVPSFRIHGGAATRFR